MNWLSAHGILCITLLARIKLVHYVVLYFSLFGCSQQVISACLIWGQENKYAAYRCWFTLHNGDTSGGYSVRVHLLSISVTTDWLELYQQGGDWLGRLPPSRSYPSQANQHFSSCQNGQSTRSTSRISSRPNRVMLADIEYCGSFQANIYIGFSIAPLFSIRTS